MSTQTIAIRESKPAEASDFNAAFIVAWAFCLLFYFMEYAARSAPSVMMPELTGAFGLSTTGLSTLIGLYYYTYAIFAVVAGFSLDRWGGKYTIPFGVLLLANALTVVVARTSNTAPATATDAPARMVFTEQARYFRRTRVPLTFCVLSAPRKSGTMRSISSKYEESAGTLVCALVRTSSRRVSE